MKRLFQHYEGKIPALKGLEIGSFFSLTEQDAGGAHVLLLWMGSRDGKWFRIFIDGHYCGVDEFDRDLSGEDLDDHLDKRDHSALLSNERISEAQVVSGEDGSIALLLSLEKTGLIRLVYRKDDKCHLQISS